MCSWYLCKGIGMKKSSITILVSFFSLMVLVAVVFLDIQGVFGFSDGVFVLGLFLGAVVYLIQKSTSKLPFSLATFFLLWMGLSYIPTGSSEQTERIGVWFFLTFFLGLVQYGVELHQVAKTMPDNRKKSVDWTEYYFNRIGSKRLAVAKQKAREHEKWYTSWIDYIDKRIPLYAPALRIFEVGSGLGGVVHILDKKNVNVTGSDVSQGVIRESKKLYAASHFVLYDIEKNIPPGKPYDRIIAFEVLEHLHDLLKAAKNIRKGLRPHGYFIGTTPYPYKHVIDMPTHVHVHGPDFWKDLFVKAGYSKVETMPMSLPPLLWRLNEKFNIIFPFYVPLYGWVSTTLIIATS